MIRRIFRILVICYVVASSFVATILGIDTIIRDKFSKCVQESYIYQRGRCEKEKCTYLTDEGDIGESRDAYLHKEVCVKKELQWPWK